MRWKASKEAWKMLLARAAHASPWWEHFNSTCTGLCKRGVYLPSMLSPPQDVCSSDCFQIPLVPHTSQTPGLSINTLLNVKTQE